MTDPVIVVVICLKIPTFVVATTTLEEGPAALVAL